jgi:hypothetical protein
MNKSKLVEIIRDIVAEEWDKDVEIKSTGEHADKTITQIKKEMEALKGKKPFNREQFSELMFALRAKQGWKKGKGATGTTEQVTKMKKSDIKQVIKTELSELLTENTNSLNQAYVVYTKALKSFEQNANKLNDKVMLKIYKEFDKLHLKITQHLDANYEGSLDESYADTMQANLPRASFAELDEAKDALESLLKNTRNDRDLLKLYKAHIKLTKVFQKHLDKNYPDWDKRMEENTKTINVRHKTTKKKLDIPDDPDTIKKYKKLGYTLWIGSREKNESVDERTIQEHDKAKVLQAMLKAGSNKAEAQALLKKHYAYVDKKYRDVPASKKAEIIVTLAGTASESNIKEVVSKYDIDLNILAKFTDQNQHILARHYIAKKRGYTKLVLAYKALYDLQSALGHFPRGADKVRSDLDKDLKKYLSKDVDNWKDVWEEL